MQREINGKKYTIRPSSNLSCADLRNADLSDADLSDADLSDADLRNADLRNADLSDANLRNANLSGANLRNADLSDANLRNANLSCADLRNADLSDADLRNADLRNANLRNADLSDADLRNADLSYADLSDADLRNANLRNADLSYADLSGADLSYANLSGAHGLLNQTQWMRDNFFYNEKRQCYCVFKAEGDTLYPMPQSWRRGSWYEDVPNSLRTNECGCGVNFATKEWIEKHYVVRLKNGSVRIRRMYLHVHDLADLVVPYNTDGKARCARLEKGRLLPRGIK